MKPLTLFIISVLFWLVETWYFGWNAKPSCNAKRVCDSIVAFFLMLGLTRMFIAAIADAVVIKLKQSADAEGRE